MALGLGPVDVLVYCGQDEAERKRKTDKADLWPLLREFRDEESVVSGRV